MYSEDALIEQTCAQLLRDMLGWNVINIFQGEVFGADGMLGRTSRIRIWIERLE
jgi:type I restriction enzyme R subunit